MLTSGLNPSAIKQAIDEFFYAPFDYGKQPGIATAENSIFFNQDKTSLGAVITEDFGGPGAFEETTETENVPEATILSKNQATRNVINFDKSLPISKRYFDDDKFGTVSKSIQAMGQRAVTTRDKKAFDIYGSGFDGTTTNAGSYLWLDTHTSVNGDTIDNLSSGALTATTFKALWRLLVIQKAQDGEIGGHIPVGFLCALNLIDTAHEVLKSELKSNTTDNNINYWSMAYPGLQIFTSAFLDSSYNDYANINTAHYLVSGNHSITRWVRSGLETSMIDWRYDAKNRYIYKAEFREVYGAVNCFGAVASTGA